MAEKRKTRSNSSTQTQQGSNLNTVLSIVIIILALLLLWIVKGGNIIAAWRAFTAPTTPVVYQEQPAPVQEQQYEAPAVQQASISSVGFNSHTFCLGQTVLIIENVLPLASNPCAPGMEFVVDEAWSADGTHHLMQQKFTDWYVMMAWLRDNNLDRGSIWAVTELALFDTNYTAFCANERPLIVEDISLSGGDPCQPYDMVFYLVEPWGHGNFNEGLTLEFANWGLMINYLAVNNLDHGSIWAKLAHAE